MGTKNLTQADNGKTVPVRSGDELVLRLAENPSTGYRWVLEGDVGAVLEVVEASSVPTAEVGIGGGGQRVWTLKAKNDGSVGLLLTLRRAWEGDRSIIKSFEVRIQVDSQH